VYEVKGDPTLAFKQYKTPVPNVLPAFDQLIAAGVDVRRSLRGAPVDLAWPTAAVPEGDELAGCLMPKVHSRYTVNVQGLTREATLDHAVPRLDSHFAPSRQPSDGERRMLAVAAGQFLHALHENDYVYGDVSWKNLLYALDPVPSVMVLDLDSIRRVGTTPWPGVGAHTADWGDPHGQPGEVGAFDEDRYKYALLVYRLLAARSLTAQMPATGDITWHADVDDRQSRRLTRLTWRAKARLERPAVSEWLAVLA
jgi:DNA-binding helix-hairpin-helix protein with protein kinase domain